MYLVHVVSDPNYPNPAETDLPVNTPTNACFKRGSIPTLACPGYVVNTILFPQFPLVCSKLPRSLVPDTASSFLSAGRLNAETLTLGLAGNGCLLNVKSEATGAAPLRGRCWGELVCGEPTGETASEGVMERIEAYEGWRWNGGSRAEGMVSSLAFMLMSADCVDIWCISSCIDAD
jgi:hypothetical protein